MISFEFDIADNSGDWFTPFVGDDHDMLWLTVSVSCIRYSKRRKFRSKMCQNAFGGRAPLGPAGGSSVSAPSGPLAGSDPDAVWDGRSGGSRNERGSVVMVRPDSVTRCD